MAAYGRMDSAILGLPYGIEMDVESYPAAVAITPGRPVYQTPGTESTCKTTYASGDVFLGIALVSQRSNIGDVGTYAIGELVNIMKKGSVWVGAASTVSTAPAKAYATSAGVFSATASGNYNVGAYFRTQQATTSGLVLIELMGSPILVA
jgi:hypothetical protein